MKLEWLKDILGDAYTEEVDNKVCAALGERFVAKADFNAKSEAVKQLEDQLAERDKQLEALKKTGGNVDELKRQIEALQKQNGEAKAAYAADIKAAKINAAVDMALVTAKTKNLKAVRALLDLDNAELAEDGTVKGLTEQIEKLISAPDSSFLFESDSSGTSFKGMQPGNAGGKTPPISGQDPKNMSYDELCAYLAENPNATL